MASFEFTWNIALGVLSIILAIQTAWWQLKKMLPSNRLRRMFELLDDADALLVSCSEEGLVQGEKAECFRRNLTRVRQYAEQVRLEANAAKSYPEDFVNMLKGLTDRIDSIYQETIEIRADISTSSMRERERLAAQQLDEVNATEGWAGQAEGTVSSDPVQNVDSHANGGEIDALGTQIATPLREAASPPRHPPAEQVPTTALHACVGVASAAQTLERVSVTTAAIAATTRPSRKKPRHSDRRCSVSSNSSCSATESLHRVRWKRTGDPVSRARAMTSLLRHSRTRSAHDLPVYIVDRQQLAVCELSEDDSDSGDDEWVDELAVRVVSCAASSHKANSPALR